MKRETNRERVPFSVAPVGGPGTSERVRRAFDLVAAVVAEVVGDSSTAVRFLEDPANRDITDTIFASTLRDPRKKAELVARIRLRVYGECGPKVFETASTDVFLDASEPTRVRSFVAASGTGDINVPVWLIANRALVRSGARGIQAIRCS